MADQAGNEVVVTLRPGEDTAWALAQFVKRVGWSEFRALAVDDEEAGQIRAGVDALQRAFGTPEWRRDEPSPATRTGVGSRHTRRAAADRGGVPAPGRGAT